MRVMFALSMLMLSGTATAADYMQDVKREPAPAAGTAQEIAKRALTCIAKSTQMESNPFVDLDSGLVVATAKANGKKFRFGQQQVIKSKLTVETKDSKFRVTHSDIMVSYISGDGDSSYPFKPVEANSKASIEVSEFLSAWDEKFSACVSSPADNF